MYIQATITTATDALAAGDLIAAWDALGMLKAAEQTARQVAHVQALIDTLQAAVTAAHEAGAETVYGLAVAERSAVAVAAS